jgi:hypothetical protein
MAHSMLNALIQLRQPLAPPLLDLIAKGFAVEATILMLQVIPMETANSCAAVHSHSEGAEWVAASNALARMRAPGFAATLLAEIPLFAVRDGLRQWRRAGTRNGGQHFFRWADSACRRIFQLLECIALPGSVALVTNWSATDRFRFTRIGCRLNWREADSRLSSGRLNLAELASAASAEVAHAVEWLTAAKWTNLLELSAEVSRGLTDQETALKHIAGLLVSAGALGTAELHRPLQIAVEMDDRRSDRSVPLPRYAPIELRFW